MNKTYIALSAALLSTVPGLLAADITGKITLKGTPPPPAEAPIKENACGNPAPLVVKSRQYVVGKDGGLAGVFIFLKSGAGIDGKTFTPPTDKPILDQVLCEYQPYTIAVQAGQTFTVRNSDPAMHNVNSTAAKKNPGKNFAQATKGQVNDMTFANPEIVRFKCDVHPWMSAYLGVFANPYFATTDADGNFTLKNVPAGKYQAVIYHPKTHGALEGIVKEVTVEASGGKLSEVIEYKAP